MKNLDSVCFFGAYDEGYPRSEVMRKGLEKNGVTVRTCRTLPRRRVVTRYAVLTYRYLTMKRDFSIIIVPEFRHKDVPLAFLLGRLTGKRIVFDPLVSRFDTKIDRGDALEGSYQAWYNRNLDRMSLGLCDMVLADTQTHADFFNREFGTRKEKIRVLPVGFDEELFSSNGTAVGTGKRPFDVLFFGSYLPLHGVDVIVEAAKLLKDHPDIHITLIGGGQTFPQVERFVRENDLSNVSLEPRVPLDRISTRIKRADVSLGVFGRTGKAGRVVANKVYQSMAVGVPVVTCDSTAIREHFTDGDDICLVPPGDASALAKRIQHLYGHPVEREAVARAGCRLVHDRFSSRQIGETLVTYLAEVAS